MAFGRGVFVCSIVALALLCSHPANPQVTGGTLSGTVSDSSGASRPAALRRASVRSGMPMVSANA